MNFCSTWKQIFTTVDAFLFISRQNLLERTSFVNNRYDADEIDDLITIVDKQTAISSITSQYRRSVDNPDVILGVDTDGSIFDENE